MIYIAKKEAGMPYKSKYKRPEYNDPECGIDEDNNLFIKIHPLLKESLKSLFDVKWISKKMYWIVQDEKVSKADLENFIKDAEKSDLLNKIRVEIENKQMCFDADSFHKSRSQINIESYNLDQLLMRLKSAKNKKETAKRFLVEALSERNELLKEVHVVKKDLEEALLDITDILSKVNAEI